MVIEKQNKSYTVNECKNHWTVKHSVSGLSVSYKIEKDLCKTKDELRNYVLSNEMF